MTIEIFDNTTKAKVGVVEKVTLEDKPTYVVARDEDPYGSSRVYDKTAYTVVTI